MIGYQLEPQLAFFGNLGDTKNSAEDTLVLRFALGREFVPNGNYSEVF